MPVIICENTECEHISKRRTRCINRYGCEMLRHTCRAKLVNIHPLIIDEDTVEYLGYKPYECVKGRKYDK